MKKKSNAKPGIKKDTYCIKRHLTNQQAQIKVVNRHLNVERLFSRKLEISGSLTNISLNNSIKLYESEFKRADFWRLMFLLSLGIAGMAIAATQWGNV